MTRYEILVVGAGPAGLMAALQAARAGKSTLLIDGGDRPGGLWQTQKQGSFQLEARPVRLQKEGEGRRLLEEAGIWQQLDWTPCQKGFDLADREGKKLTFAGGTENYLQAVEEFCPGSRESMEDFLELAKTAEEAQAYLAGAPRVSRLKMLFKHPRYLRTAGFTVDQVLEALEMPAPAAHCAKAMFHRLGAEAGQLKFGFYGPALLEYLQGEELRPSRGGHSLMLALEQALYRAGGQIWYHCPVDRLLVQAGQVCGARLKNGREVYAEKVVADAPAQKVLESWLSAEPLYKAKAAALARGWGCQAAAVLLGLNKTPQQLGITWEQLAIQNREIPAGSGLEAGPALAVCTPEQQGCTLALYGLYAADAWAAVKEEQYRPALEAVAKKMLEGFEAAAGVSVQGAVEEACLLGPAEYAALGGGRQGQMLWQTPQSWQLPEISALPEETHPMEGLWLCGKGSGAATLDQALKAGAKAGKEAAE